MPFPFTRSFTLTFGLGKNIQFKVAESTKRNRVYGFSVSLLLQLQLQIITFMAPMLHYQTNLCK